jgi:hypothetical protein
MCSWLLNLRRNLLGPIVAKEKGIAKSHALIKAVLIDLVIVSFL